MRLAFLLLFAAACAPEAQINLIEAPYLVDSYPGNGSVLPADQAGPLLLRFSKPVAEASSAGSSLRVEALDQDGAVANEVPMSPCVADAEGLLLECPVAGELSPSTRYRITVEASLLFASGETMTSDHQRWFQTMP